jgi:hypothetical protein
MKSVIRHAFIALSVFSLGLGFTSCKTSRNATEATAVSTETKVKTKRNEAAKYVEQIEKAYPKASHLTAKTKMQIKYGSKDLSVSGNLKMKRDEAIQLSLRVLGFEVGRVEFTPVGVLVLDRINSKYFRATYNDVSYLKASGLDFNALQSLFWNELFAPNDQSKKKKDERFDVNVQKNKIQLKLADAPKLDYDFTIDTADSRIKTVKVTPKNTSRTDELLWNYSQFESFGEGTFPAQMNCKAQMGKHKGEVTFILSKINQDSDWNAQSEIPSKYKEKSIESIVKLLLSL